MSPTDITRRLSDRFWPIWVRFATGGVGRGWSALWITMLFPLELLYRAGLMIRDTLYRCGFIGVHRLGVRVVGVGNITVGGTGKTPLVQLLAKRFWEQGIRVAILSRGYGRKEATGEPLLLVEQAAATPASTAGDEAFVLAGNVPGVRIVVGKNRVRSGRIAEQSLGSQVAILDDSFQYRRLKKDLEIVLVDVTCPFGNGRLLPSGVLREPVRSLRRAGLVILSRADEVEEGNLESVARSIRRAGFEGPIAKARHVPTRLLRYGDHAELPPDHLRGKTIWGFCGIGNPASFRRTLDELNANVVDLAIFPDHHWYTVRELEALVGSVLGKGGDAIVTTEKDAVRIPKDFGPPPELMVLSARLEISEGGEALEDALREAMGWRASY